MAEVQGEAALGVSSQEDLSTSWPPDDFSSDIVSMRSTSTPPSKGSHATVEEQIIVDYDGHTLRLKTILEEDELAPLFDGAYWPGSMVWPVSLWTGDYIHRHLKPLLAKGGRMIELGCGCGVPGMMGALMGGYVALTEQPELIRFLHMNIKHNFPPPQASTEQAQALQEEPRIFADSLFWSRDNALQFMKRPGWSRVDLVVCCDCIYEPFWGDSYVALLDCVEALCWHDEALALISVERRNADGVDKFVALAKQRMELSMPLTDAAKGWQLYALRKKRRGA